jgi:hypothetical protein
MTDEPVSDQADEPVSDLTLAEILGTSAEDLPDVSVTTDDDVTTWSTAGRPFATLAGEWAEFRLDPMVARAALRTGDTSPSTRGPEWVVFAPSTMDDPAIDRAEAWFLSAYRLAAAVRH